MHTAHNVSTEKAQFVVIRGGKRIRVASRLADLTRRMPCVGDLIIALPSWRHIAQGMPQGWLWLS